MRRPLNEYSTLRRGYEKQRQQENEEWMLQVATFRKSSRWFMHSLGSHLMMWKREFGQMKQMAVILFRHRLPFIPSSSLHSSTQNSVWHRRAHRFEIKKGGRTPIGEKLRSAKKEHDMVE